MAKNALIVCGGWDGHQPNDVGEIFRRALTEDGFSVRVSETLDALADAEALKSVDLIVPVWTMGKLSGEQMTAVNHAVVEGGTGVAGCHGGMCDAFRENTEWQFMTGGQFVSHPGNDGTKYTVRPLTGSHPIVEGIGPFEVISEQYYMHVDPANRVLATTEIPTAAGPHTPNGRFEMPVIWTRYHGKGKIFYNSLGHSTAVTQSEPSLTLTRRGFLWAAR